MSQARDPLVGAIVDGRYRVSAALGEGGMAIVYLAHHVTLQRHVALKVLRPVLARNERAIGRFAREARAASLLDHENLVSVLDFGLAPEGFYYLAMEYVAGTPLDVEIARTAPFPMARAVHIASQIAVGAAHGHDRGIVHRDLKPENVMLTTRGADRDFVKVVDFGLAKPTLPNGLGPTLTEPGDLFGTPHYMAPEVWRGDPVDGRADVYALGVILYEMLCAELPFAGRTPVDLMNAHLRERPAPPSTRARGASVPTALDSVVIGCLAKDPRERFPHMAAVLDALRSAWEVARAPALRTTYGAGSTHGRGASLATLYQPGELDVVWDGPILTEEISHLQRLRCRRLADIADQLWPSTVPDGVLSLRNEIESLEARADVAAQRVAVLRAELEELDSTVRPRAAELRNELVRANIARAAQTIVTLSEVDEAEPLDDRDPVTRLRAIERRLASFEARALEEQLRRQVELADEMAAVAHVERELGRRYEALGRMVQDLAEPRPELGSLLVELGEVEGALASYEALLSMWDRA